MKIREKLWFNELLEKHPIRNYKGIGIDQSDYEIAKELEIISTFLDNILDQKILNSEEVPAILEYLSETKSLVKSELTFNYLRYIEDLCKEYIDYENKAI